MPEQKTIERARRKKRQGQAPSTQAGEFVREEMEHIREGKHGARSAKQAIAIGLSKARQAGVKLAKNPNAKSKKATSKTRRKKPSRLRSKATLRALQREPRSAASHRSLSRQAHQAARKRKAARARAHS